MKQLEELNEIKEQVISLNLNKLPVKDEDLKTVSRFKNLRRLDLNFTNITARGLDALASLKFLQTLSLSGTKVFAISTSPAAHRIEFVFRCKVVHQGF